MPKFEVTLPDGRRYEVDAPEENTAYSWAMQTAQQEDATNAQRPGFPGAITEGLGTSATGTSSVQQPVHPGSQAGIEMTFLYFILLGSIPILLWHTHYRTCRTEKCMAWQWVAWMLFMLMGGPFTREYTKHGYNEEFIAFVLIDLIVFIPLSYALGYAYGKYKNKKNK